VVPRQQLLTRQKMSKRSRTRKGSSGQQLGGTIKPFLTAAHEFADRAAAAAAVPEGHAEEVRSGRYTRHALPSFLG